MKKLLCLLLILALALSLSGCNKAKTVDFPTRDIELIIPWTAGGGTDVAGRLYAKYAEEELGTTINVINVPGGNSGVGLTQAANSEPDGYTLALLTTDILTVEAQGLAPVSYKDFKIINKFSIQPTVLVVRKDSGWETLDDYREAALANPGGIKVGVNGEGAIWHQAGILADEKMGIETSYVPYNGSSEQIAALLGGHIDATYISYNTAYSHIQEGTLVALAVMTEERIEKLSDVPTFKELGYDVVYNSWRAMAVPKDTPDEIADILRDAFKRAFENEEYQKKCEEAMIDGDYVDHVEFTKFLDESYPVVYEILDKLGYAKKNNN